MSRLYESGSKPRELEDYPPMLQARHIMEILGVCEAVAYQILHHQDCPRLQFGKRLVVPREDFWEFLMSYRGKSLW